MKLKNLIGHLCEMTFVDHGRIKRKGYLLRVGDEKNASGFVFCITEDENIIKLFLNREIVKIEELSELEKMGIKTIGVCNKDIHGCGHKGNSEIKQIDNSFRYKFLNGKTTEWLSL